MIATGGVTPIYVFSRDGWRISAYGHIAGIWARDNDGTHGKSMLEG
jgi:hypothetical protein